MSEWCEAGHKKGQRGCALCEAIDRPAEPGKDGLGALNPLKARIIQLERQITELQAKLDQCYRDNGLLMETLRRVKSAMRFLEDLTPGGSEFSGDSKFCFEYIKDQLHKKHGALKAKARIQKERDQLKADLSDAHLKDSAKTREINLLVDENRQQAAFLERHGYRRCDIAACNCGSWHGGHAEQQIAELATEMAEADQVIKKALEQTEDGLHQSPCDEPDCWIEACEAYLARRKGGQGEY